MTADAPDTVVAAEIARAVIPLATPVRLGSATIRERIYVALRLTLADGSAGYAYGYDRGTPLFEVVHAAATRYLGRRAWEAEALRREAVGPTPAPRATMVRGVSLCDIALRDAACVATGLPLHATIATLRDKVELMPVIGYGMTPEVAAREGAALSGRGFRTIKLMIDGNDIDFDRAVVAALARALPAGVRFGLDAHWSWVSAEAALPWCRLAEEHGAVFLEDPVAPTDWRIAAAIRAETSVPICLGEDAIDLASLRDMAEAADILRLDAAASGGIGYALDGLALAERHGRTVIPHVFPTLHQHLGFANGRVTRVEAILPELGADPIDRFLARPPEIDGGDLRAPQHPGAGLALDWDAFSAFVVRKETMTR